MFAPLLSLSSHVSPKPIKKGSWIPHPSSPLVATRIFILSALLRSFKLPPEVLGLSLSPVEPNSSRHSGSLYKHSCQRERQQRNLCALKFYGFSYHFFFYVFTFVFFLKLIRKKTIWRGKAFNVSFKRYFITEKTWLSCFENYTLSSFPKVVQSIRKTKIPANFSKLTVLCFI